jgi:hypothetical protein
MLVTADIGHDMRACMPFRMTAGRRDHALLAALVIGVAAARE